MTLARFRTEAAATLHLGTPLIAAQLAQVSMGFVDAVMAGRLSPIVHGGMFMAAIFQISDGLQVSGLGALRGLKDTKVPMYITVIAYWIVGMPLGYTLGITLNGGARAMWVGIICGLTAAAILLNARFYLVTRPRAQMLCK
jgi:Na+-driven multidrug efflux pump